MKRPGRPPRRLVRIVAPVLVGAALASLASIAVANQIATARLDQEQSLIQLEELQRSRERAITGGIGRLRTSVSLLATDRAVVDALLEFRSAVGELDQAVAEGASLLTDDEESALRDVIAELLDDASLQRAVLEAGRPMLTVDEILSPDPTARYLQYRYLRLPRPVAGAATSDIGPGAAYAAAHARHSPILARLGGGFPDVWLVDLEGDRVVHTVAGGPELGSSATAGTIGDTVVGRLLEVDLRRTTAGEVALSDVGPYLGGPSMFLAEAIRDGSEIIGAVVVRVPVDLLDGLMTAEGRWAEVGLGETGQTYVVGRDQRLRSSARRHIEDPDAYVAMLRARGDDALADLVTATGSTVLITPVETRPVRTALDARRFSGRAGGLDAADTLTVASPLGVAGLDWIVVAQIDRDEAMAESSQQLTRQVLLAALLLPAVAAAGVLLAWYLVRPVRPLVAAAERVAGGAEESGLVDQSRDEFGHLARELDRAAASLAAERARLAAERAAIDELLAASLSPPAIEAVRRGEPFSASRSATVIAIAIDAGNPEYADDETGEIDLEQLIDRHDEITGSIAAMADTIGAERIRAAGGRLLYLVDDADGAGPDVAQRLADAITAEHPDTHIGIATGSVTIALVGGERPTLTAWGPPVRSALRLLAAGRRGQVLTDP